jgi:hypothetical protein
MILSWEATDFVYKMYVLRFGGFWDMQGALACIDMPQWTQVIIFKYLILLYFYLTKLGIELVST